MDWSPDILGAPYQARTLEFPADDQGRVTATLVRRLPSSTPESAPGPALGSVPGSAKAVLYVHGYTDYFFQTHLADFWIEQGYDFYALDLRKSGRSLLPHQTPYFCRSVTEYYPELDEALRIIRQEDGHDRVVINAHSTGGLTTSLWAHSRGAVGRPSREATNQSSREATNQSSRGTTNQFSREATNQSSRGTGAIDALVLNSPFLDLNAPRSVRLAAGDAVAVLGLRRPYAVLPIPDPGLYPLSLHQDHHGEWVFDLNWKPLRSFGVRAGWLRAIRAAQRRLQAGIAVPCPVLVMCSTASSRRRSWDAELLRTDAVLDVSHIARWASSIGPLVTVAQISDGMHDLALSAEPVRAEVFATMSRWLSAYGPS
jgi:alpha-beta hydrolase superfamily lysophospholipase